MAAAHVTEATPQRPLREGGGSGPEGNPVEAVGRWGGERLGVSGRGVGGRDDPQLATSARSDWRNEPAVAITADGS